MPDNQQFLDLRIAVLGCADAGKSTLLGVLTQGESKYIWFFLQIRVCVVEIFSRCQLLLQLYFFELLANDYNKDFSIKVLDITTRASYCYLYISFT